jgi:phosphosulfolactate synthase
LDIPLKDRLNVIAHAKDEFNVIAEVGSKDCNLEMDISEWKEEMQIFLEAGCEFVITEGRESGTAGIYQSNGQVKSELIDELVKGLDVKKIIFEAPTSKHQMFFINQVGPNVNLGNVRLDDVLALEAQRNGLRSETFYLEDADAAYINQTPTH